MDACVFYQLFASNTFIRYDCCMNFRITQVNTPPDFIDFGIGQPGFELLPLDLLRTATAQRLAEPDPAFLNYGYPPGNGRFHHALAAFLQAQTGHAPNPERLLTTNGVSQALDMICTLFTQPGDTVFVEEPTYFLALRIFADHGLRVVGIPVDSAGMRIEALEAALSQHQPRFVYTIPVFQNPSGVTLSPARRQALLALSAAHDFLIVADEVYQLLPYTITPPPSFAAFADNERVLALGSFSKILAPGLRLGWLSAPPSLHAKIADCALLDSGGGLNPFTSALVCAALENGSQETYLRQLRAIYAERLQVMAAALQRHLGTAVSITKPDGGFFFWVQFAPKINATVLQQHAQAQRVGFRPGVRFSSSGRFQNAARLSFAFYPPAQIEAGVQRLARAVATECD